jgi:uncharacterized membrane protein
MTVNPLFHPVIIVSIVLLALVAATFLPLRYPGTLSRWVRGVLIGMRIAAILILAIILFNPSRLEPQKLPKPRQLNLVLLDTSQSMGLEAPASRLRQSLGILQPALASERLHENILAFRFDAAAKPAPLALDALASPDGNPVNPNGAQTLLYHNLFALLQEHAGEGIANVVVLTDGQAHDTAAAETAGKPGVRPVQGQLVKFCQEQEIPVSAFVAGSASRILNTTIENIQVDRSAPSEASLTLNATLRHLGPPPGTVTLTLRTTDGNIRAQKTFTTTPVASGGNDTTTTRFSLPFKAGTQSESLTFTVDPHQSGELTLLDNRINFDMKIENPKLRVLYMEGSPEEQMEVEGDYNSRHYAYELIPRALNQAGDIEIETLIVDQQLEVGGKLYRIRDPNRGFPTTREELFKYDVVICSDINRYVFTEAQIEWVRQLVAENGGGFVMIGGNTSFGSGGWDKTIWEKMIPVDMNFYGTGLIWQTINTSVPAAARSHPIWRLLPDEAASNKVLDNHPRFLGTNQVSRAKPGATVLLETAVPRTSNPYMSTIRQPMICVQAYGKGRSMAFTSDAAGGWGVQYHYWGERGKDNRYYRRFWVNTIRWLAENSQARYGEQLVGSTNRLVFQPGETAALAATLPRRKAGDTTPVIVTARLENRPETIVTLQPDPATQTFNGSLKIPSDLSSNPINLVFSAENPKTRTAIGSDKINLQIIAFDKEFANPAPAPDDLATLARLTHGRMIKNASELTALFNDSLKQNRKTTENYRIPLWDAKWLWLAFCTLLIAIFLVHRLATIRK